MLIRVLEEDAHTSLKFAPATLGNLEGRLRDLTHRNHEGRVQGEDNLADEDRQVLEIWATYIEPPFVSSEFTLLAERHSHRPVHDRACHGCVLAPRFFVCHITACAQVEDGVCLRGELEEKCLRDPGTRDLRPRENAEPLRE